MRSRRAACRRGRRRGTHRPRMRRMALRSDDEHASAAATRPATSANIWSSSTTRRNATARSIAPPGAPARTGASVVMLRVIETGDRNQQWLGVADIMKAEAHEAANAALDKYAARANGHRRHHARARDPRGRHRRGDPQADRRGRGHRASWCWPPAPARKARARWSRSLGKTAGTFPIPVAIVPGHLSDEDIDALS